MPRRRDVLLAVIGVVLIAFGAATLKGAAHWPEQHRGPRVSSAISFETQSPCYSVKATSSAPTSASGGAVAIVSATAVGCPKPLYQFWILAPGAASYEMVQGYSTRATFSWNPAGVQPGTYRFSVWARDLSSDGINSDPLGRWDAFDNSSTFGLAGCSFVSITLTPTSLGRLGNAVTLNATASGCRSPVYRFFMLAPGGASYQSVRDYAPSPSFTLRTTGLNAGKYRFVVWARESATTGSVANNYGGLDTSNLATYQLG